MKREENSGAILCILAGIAAITGLLISIAPASVVSIGGQLVSISAVSLSSAGLLVDPFLVLIGGILGAINLKGLHQP